MRDICCKMVKPPRVLVFPGFWTFGWRIERKNIFSRGNDKVEKSGHRTRLISVIINKMFYNRYQECWFGWNTRKKNFKRNLSANILIAIFFTLEHSICMHKFNVNIPNAKLEILTSFWSTIFNKGAWLKSAFWQGAWLIISFWEGAWPNSVIKFEKTYL